MGTKFSLESDSSVNFSLGDFLTIYAKYIRVHLAFFPQGLEIILLGLELKYLREKGCLETAFR